MVAEAAILCIDTSDYARNSDYDPTRMIAQREAALAITEYRLGRNPENTVGILTQAGKRPNVVLSPTPASGDVTGALFGLKADGTCDILGSLLCAQLALKSRADRSHSQCIVLFVGSPMTNADVQSVERAAKVIRKAGISLDIISFAECSRNHDMLKKIFEIVNADDGGHFIEVPNGADLTAAVRTAMLDAGGEGNFDMNDPELMLALRLSLEEDQARRAAAEAAGSRVEAQSEELSRPMDQALADERLYDPDFVMTIEQIESMDIDEELKQALKLSLQDQEGDANTIVHELEAADNIVEVADNVNAWCEVSAENDDMLAEMLSNDDLDDPEIKAAIETLRQKNLDSH